MRKVNNFRDQFFIIIPGGVYGILSIFFFVFGIFIAFLSFPGYSIFDYDVSYLALSPGGIFFNLGLIFSGLLAIPFNIYLGKIIIGENVNEKLRKKLINVSMIVSISISLTGIFPAYPDNVIIGTIHGLLALIFFLSVTLVFIMYGYFFLKNSKFLKFQAYLSFFVASILCFYMLFRYSILEWICFFAIIISTLYISLFTLYKKY